MTAAREGTGGEPAGGQGGKRVEALVREYLDAFEARDLLRCMVAYADDAVLEFQSSLYRGREQIEQWHRDRFAADLRLVCLDAISVAGDTVTAEGVATSNRLRVWKIESISGVATFVVREGRIRDVRFAARLIREMKLGFRGRGR